MNEHYPFQLKPLPYSYEALEPYIDAQTVMIHHDRHLQTYVNNLNKALESYPEYHAMTLHDLIVRNKELPESIQTAVYNNAGGVYNHNMYFDIMAKDVDSSSSILKREIEKTFSSFDEFVKQLTAASLGRFGSGYGWLVLDKDKKLKIISTANQDSPLSLGYCPIMPLDVWEHAYYLKYQNKRNEYVENWFHLINWNAVDKLYQECMNK